MLYSTQTLNSPSLIQSWNVEYQTEILVILLCAHLSHSYMTTFTFTVV